jgi:hypothetical protein
MNMSAARQSTLNFNHPGGVPSFHHQASLHQQEGDISHASEFSGFSLPSGLLPGGSSFAATSSKQPQTFGRI